nr:hypothetical protein SYMBAF_100340 [Serratia symbiotica]
MRGKDNTPPGTGGGTAHIDASISRRRRKHRRCVTTTDPAFKGVQCGKALTTFQILALMILAYGVIAQAATGTGAGHSAAEGTTKHDDSSPVGVELADIMIQAGHDNNIRPAIKIFAAIHSKLFTSPHAPCREVPQPAGSLWKNNFIFIQRV